MAPTKDTAVGPKSGPAGGAKATGVGGVRGLGVAWWKAVGTAKKAAVGTAKPLPAELRDLIDQPLVSPALATRTTDGRLIPLVLATVTDSRGVPRGGVTVELLSEHGDVVDATRSSASGLAVLRFSPRAPADRPAGGGERGAARGRGRGRGGGGGDDDEGGGIGPAVRGSIRVLDGSETGDSDAIEIPADASHVIRSYPLDALDRSEAERAPVYAIGDDQLSRLPVDFTPATCAELSTGRVAGLLGPSGLGTRDDPLFPGSGLRDLGGRRTPLIRRLDVVRRTADGRRWLVQLRQEWVLLGYTLGELSDVAALDPGAVVQHADQVIDQLATTARDTAEGLRATLTDRLDDLLSSVGSVDTVIRATAHVEAGAGGWGIGIPGLVGYADVDATVDANVAVNSAVDTTLLTNRSMQQVATLVNEAIARTRAVVESTQHTAANVINRLAPIVTKVTNALRWRVYENYAVCTHVEGVLAIQGYPIRKDPNYTFAPEDALAFRAFLEPALLDRTLAQAFTALAAAAASPGIATAQFAVTYTAFGNPATATVTLGSSSTTLQLPPAEQATVRGTLTFPAPIVPGSRVMGYANLTPGRPLGPVPAALWGQTSLDVHRFELWVDNAVTGPPDQVVDNPAGAVGLDVTTEGVPVLSAAAALLEHLNRNKAYYLDVLASAAVRFPALRVDAGPPTGPLADIPPDVWRLPIVGFEGNRVLVARPLEKAEQPEAGELLGRDPGSGTLIQLLAPGAYGEVLQGALALADPANTLHPALKAVAPISQFVEFPDQPVLPPVASVPAGATGVPGAATPATGAAGGAVDGLLGNLLP